MRLAHRLAVLTAAATCVLIVFGGLVTNTGAALAVPDWPTTFGHNMFLFPWSGMVGGVFYEHSHRLLGALVGLLTLALALALWGRGGRLRALGLLAVAAVVLQGVIGGLRVVLLTDALAMVHGPLAQAFFALVVAIALVTSTRMARPAPAVDGVTRGLSLASAALVFVLVPMVTARLRRTGDPVAAPASRLLLLLLGLQLALGIGSYLSRFSGVWIPGGQLTMLVLPVTHRLAGGLILAAAVVLAVRVLTAARPAPSTVSAHGALRVAQ